MSESKKLYIVVGESGDYSDHASWSIVACTSENRATELANKLTRITELHNDFVNRIYEFNKKHDEDHPPLTIAYPDKPKASEAFKRVMTIPAKDKTDEDRALFQRLRAEHERNLELYRQEYNRIRLIRAEHANVREAACSAWIKENYKVPNDLLEVVKYVGVPANGYYHNNSTYSHTSIEVVE